MRPLILCLALLAGCGGSDSPLNSSQAQTVPPPQRVILGIGDSIMAGYIPGDGLSQRLAQRKSFLLELEPLGFVIGSPVGGASTAAALSNQVAWATTPFDPSATLSPPAVVVVMLGTNDAVTGITRAEALENMRKIVASFPNSVRVIVSPPHWSAPADEWMAPWSRDLQALAADTGSLFVDAHTPSLTRSWQCTLNNRHPCENAHREIGRLIADALKSKGF
jgi:lysophospholipase L1-like esterase